MKTELTVVGAACAVCCAPLIVGAVVAAPAVAAVGAIAAVAAGASAVVRRGRKGQAAGRPSQYRKGVPEVARALALFALAGLAEIGGGWLVWQFLRESRP